MEYPQTPCIILDSSFPGSGYPVFNMEAGVHRIENRWRRRGVLRCCRGFAQSRRDNSSIRKSVNHPQALRRQAGMATVRRSANCGRKFEGVSWVRVSRPLLYGRVDVGDETIFFAGLGGCREGEWIWAAKKCVQDIPASLDQHRFSVKVNMILCFPSTLVSKRRRATALVESA